MGLGEGTTVPLERVVEENQFEEKACKVGHT